MSDNVLVLQGAAAAVGRDIRTKNRASAARGPEPWDIHVGQRLRQARILKGVSQNALAEVAGITFQQVQKYEKGTNRISASKLVRFAETLGVTPAWFFDDADSSVGSLPPTTNDLGAFGQFELDLARDIAALPGPVRQRVSGLVRALIASEVSSAKDAEGHSPAKPDGQHERPA